MAHICVLSLGRAGKMKNPAHVAPGESGRTFF
jgi:hypothetical protein